MTKRRASRPLLNRLLSGREGLSKSDQEDVLAQVLGAHAARPGWWSLPSFRVATLLLATSAVLALVWVQPWVSEDDFTARGVASASFELSCLNAGVLSSCQEGSALAFRVATPAPAYFSALSLSADGDALWYFSNVRTPGGVLERAPVLGPQPPERVVVIGVFTPAPIDKASLRERLAQGDATLHVVRRTLPVSP